MLTKEVSKGVQKGHFLEIKFSRQKMKKHTDTFTAFLSFFTSTFFFTGFFFIFSRVIFCSRKKTLILTAQIEVKSTNSAQVKVLRSAKILISAQM